MKISFLKYVLATVAILAVFQPQFSISFAQGSLTPPGAPAPTMKSLDQIEPRIIVNAVNTPGNANALFVITQPGSYYLTTNLTGVSGMSGIFIETNNVTLDLNGFAVQGVLDATYGIVIPNVQTNITVRNGVISDWGAIGLFDDSGSFNLIFEHLNVSDCIFGIYAYGHGTIRDCIVEDNDNNGIYLGSSAIISGCTAEFNGSGIFARNGVISGCAASYNTDDGIDGSDVLLSSCTADNNGGAGIDVEGTVSGCTANGNDADGIDAYEATVSGCTTRGNGDSGIYGEQTVVSGCTTSGNDNNGVELDSLNTGASPGTVSGCVVQDNKENGIFINGFGGVISGNNCDYNNTSTNSGCAGICVYGGSANNQIENNHVMGTGYAGINVSGSDNIIIKNSVSGNGGNDYLISGAQIVGPFITAVGTLSSTSPWANFSF